MISSALRVVAADNALHDVQFIAATCWCTPLDADLVRTLTTTRSVIFAGCCHLQNALSDVWTVFCDRRLAFGNMKRRRPGVSLRCGQLTQLTDILTTIEWSRRTVSTMLMLYCCQADVPPTRRHRHVFCGCRRKSKKKYQFDNRYSVHNDSSITSSLI